MLLENNAKWSFLEDKISIVMLLKSELKGASNQILIRIGNGKILYCITFYTCCQWTLTSCTHAKINSKQ